MRIIAGIAGGIPLAAPRSLARPTADRVREALFSILGDRVDGAAVLDLFAGSGALGIEALSRGAHSALFVELQSDACRTIEVNLTKARLRGGEVRKMEVLRFLKQSGPSLAARFDLIFADPPYARDEEKRKILDNLLNQKDLPMLLKQDGLFVLEVMEHTPLPSSTPWQEMDRRRYGGTELAFLTKAADPAT